MRLSARSEHPLMLSSWTKWRISHKVAWSR